MSLPFISIVVPVYNEEKILARSVGILTDFLKRNISNPFEIIIADNGSTDRTLEHARVLAKENPCVRLLHLDQKGRGRALKAAWSQSAADVLCYMDVDLSTELSAFPRMIEALGSGEFDLATGSRLHPESLTIRCWKREIISRVYNGLVRALFRIKCTDAQCGFKAITREAARVLLPLVEDKDWFFDTELLVLAERSGFRIFDLPVRWTEGGDSRVKILRTAVADLRGLVRLWRMQGKSEMTLRRSRSRRDRRLSMS